MEEIPLNNNLTKEQRARLVLKKILMDKIAQMPMEEFQKIETSLKDKSAKK